MRRLLAALCLLGLLQEDGLAQQRRAPPPPVKEEPAPEPPPAAYEPDLLRLAEVLGALSYMSALCGEPGSADWRLRMGQLIEAEGSTSQRRERLAGAFNRGFLGYQPAHRVCTDRSRQAVERLIDQGQRLARDIASRYTG